MTLVARVEQSVGAIAPEDWDRLAGHDNPFTTHAFLTALEESGSVGGGSGWIPLPVLIEGPDGRPAAALPAYLKQHSQGEYVFDQGWADAWERAGGDYYPKLQISVPFTPATGPRLLCGEHPELALPLLRAAEAVVDQNGLSSAHATFIAPGQVAVFEEAGWLLRNDLQFHWTNRGYGSFDDFLAALSSGRRKNLRKERAAAQAGVRIERLTGRAIRPEHWDAFWDFYQDTGARKWGRPYLTRAAFDLIGARMADRVLLVMAFDEAQQPVAGALNFIGADTLYGRYWGCLVDKPFLHFELCYYQAIDAAIELGLARVEAGAQGPHKLARGYEPVRTWSAHYIADHGFRRAVAEFLDRERAGIAQGQIELAGQAPYRKGG